MTSSTDRIQGAYLSRMAGSPGRACTTEQGRHDERQRARELGQPRTAAPDRLDPGKFGGRSGHPTSSMSAADLMAYFSNAISHYTSMTRRMRTERHLVFSKGHASPLLYALYRAAGAIDDDELLSYRRLG